MGTDYGDCGAVMIATVAGTSHALKNAATFALAEVTAVSGSSAGGSLTDC